MEKVFLVLAVFGILFFFPSMVLAHQPFWNPGSSRMDEAYRIENPDISQAVFGRLNGGERAFFLLEEEREFLLRASLFVGGGCQEAFRPRFWLVSEYLPDGKEGLSFLPQGMKAQEIRGEWRPFRGHGLSAVKGPEIVQRLPGGRFYLVVEAPEVGGWYLVSLNGREVPGGSPEGWQAIPRFNRCRE